PGLSRAGALREPGGSWGTLARSAGAGPGAGDRRGGGAGGRAAFDGLGDLGVVAALRVAQDDVHRVRGLGAGRAVRHAALVIDSPVSDRLGAVPLGPAQVDRDVPAVAGEADRRGLGDAVEGRDRGGGNGGVNARAHAEVVFGDLVERGVVVGVDAARAEDVGVGPGRAV